MFKVFLITNALCFAFCLAPGLHSVLVVMNTNTKEANKMFLTGTEFEHIVKLADKFGIALHEALTIYQAECILIENGG